MARQLGEVRAVLFDRDDTLVQLESRRPNGPVRVKPMPGAVRALDRLRAEGIPMGVLCTHRGPAQGHVVPTEPDRVNARVEEILGPFDTWRRCPHGARDRCACHGPDPSLVLQAADDLGVAAHRVAVIGDIGSDVQAAQAAGAVGILVPSARTLQAEVRDAPLVAWSLREAVTLVLARYRIGLAVR